MVLLRIETTIQYFEYAPSEGRKIEHKQILQQYVNLFSHIYHKKPLREFNNLTTLDGIH